MESGFRSILFVLVCTCFPISAFSQDAPAALNKNIVATQNIVVTQKDVKAKGGYAFNVEKMGSFALVSLKTSKRSTKQCNIKLEDLKSAVLNEKDKSAMRKALAAGRGIVKVELQIHHNETTGDVFCAGGGKGCVATVEIKSVQPM